MHDRERDSSERIAEGMRMIAEGAHWADESQELLSGADPTERLAMEHFSKGGCATHSHAASLFEREGSLTPATCQPDGHPQLSSSLLNLFPYHAIVYNRLGSCWLSACRDRHASSSIMRLAVCSCRFRSQLLGCPIEIIPKVCFLPYFINNM